MKSKNYGLDPENERKRMRELMSYDILDSIGEKEYDDLTRLASIICQTPMALVTFIDGDRQWFKSAHGIGGTETPRQYAFCAHTILNPDEPLVVEDSRLDDRFKDNPYVTGEPNVVFYAGIPLNSNGHGLGSFCIIDTKPRVLTPEQMEALDILARQAMSLLELRKSNMELNIKHESLELKNKNLDKIIEDRIAHIARQNTELEKANKELQAFNYVSSHDLQEPLRKIQTFSSIIAERELDNLSDSGKNYFAKIGQASSRMSHLINDLLAYSRSTTGKGKYETVLFTAVVNDVVADLSEEITEKNATVNINGDGSFKAIGFQFRQAIYNLVSNAIKFSKPGVAPVINITYTSKAIMMASGTNKLAETTQHIISVRDNGIGFDSRYSEKIFEVFQRLETKEKQSGTGIGLAIVKKIVDNHKGTIAVESTAGAGTSFTLTLPGHA